MGRVKLKVLIQPDNFPHTLSCSTEDTVLAVKSVIAKDLNTAQEFIQLDYHCPLQPLFTAGDLESLEVESEAQLVGREDRLALRELGCEDEKTYTWKVFLQKEALKGPSGTNNEAGQADLAHLNAQCPSIENTTREGNERGGKTVIEISKHTKPKHFEGGFKHRVTGIIYLNTSTQTVQHRRREARGEETRRNYVRDTQTVDYVAHTCQTVQSHSCQTRFSFDTADEKLPRKGTTISEANLYFSSEDLHILQQRVTLRLQMFWRQLVSKRKLRTLKTEKQRKLGKQVAVKEMLDNEQEADRRRRAENRQNPETGQDFIHLLEDIQQWKASVKHDSPFEPIPHHSVSSTVLELESKKLKRVDQLKRSRMKSIQEETRLEILDLLGRDKIWLFRRERKLRKQHEQSDLGGISQVRQHGVTIEPIAVETETTRRAKLLRNFYLALSNQSHSYLEARKREQPNPEALSVYQREKKWLETLVKTKWIIKARTGIHATSQHKTDLERSRSRRRSVQVKQMQNELLELIDREADLLHRGRISVAGHGRRVQRKGRVLAHTTRTGLEQRIVDLFFDLCLEPEINPEAQQMQRRMDKAEKREVEQPE